MVYSNVPRHAVHLFLQCMFSLLTMLRHKATFLKPKCLFRCLLTPVNGWVCRRMHHLIMRGTKLKQKPRQDFRMILGKIYIGVLTELYVNLSSGFSTIAVGV